MNNIYDLLTLSRGELRALGRSLRDGLIVVAESAPETANALKVLYPEWRKGSPGETVHYAADGTCYICPFDGNLYRVRTGMDHDAPADDNYAPSRYHAAWEPVVKPEEDGSISNPYTFVSGMAVTAGKYYRQNDLLCLCKRSEAHLYGELANFVGSYMEVVA